MTDTELRELDAWIAEHVMHLQPAFAVVNNGLYYRPEAKGYTTDINKAWHCTKSTAEAELCPGEIMSIVPIPTPSYTTDPAAALRVLKKCIFRRNLAMSATASEWIISDDLPESEIQSFTSNIAEAQTLELAICLFAKKIFT